MKYLYILLIIPIIGSFFACSEDEVQAAGSLHGRWIITEVETPSGFVPADQTCWRGSYSQFEANGTYAALNTCSAETDNGSYRIADNLITAEVDGNIITYTIGSMNDNVMEFEIDRYGNRDRLRARRNPNIFF